MLRNTEKKPEKERKITFYTKESIRCPVCDASFKREELFSGRLNVDELTDELHRQYKPKQAFGDVYPLVYEMDVCPHCYYAAFRADFEAAGRAAAVALNDAFSRRTDSVASLFKRLDFQAPRGLLEGIASYYLAIQCYEFVPADFSPTIKSAIAAVRAAWLCKDMHKRQPTENWDYMATLLYRKARFFYKHALELEASGKEAYSNVRILGPDTDKNYGHEGVIYMSAVLELKYGPTDNREQRNKALNAGKNAIARMFGVGKKTKAKPGPLLERARELYERMKHELKDAADDDEHDE